MENTGYIGLSGRGALNREMAVIANNIANMNTPAFRAKSVLFVEFLQETTDPSTGQKTTISQVQDVATFPDLKEGPLLATDNPLDLAISGKGYFTIETQRGDRYTRNGQFTTDVDGQIVTASGDPLLAKTGRPFKIPAGATDIQITRDGTVSVRDPINRAASIVLGQIELVTFENEYELKQGQDGLYKPQDGVKPEEAEAEDVDIIQNMIEQSNVKGVIEMTKLIDVTRRYQSSSNMMEDEHKRMRDAISTLTQRASA
ncbi:flagellar basal-body rod protein FlgF [Rhodovibrionaceae bacterium A322]